MSFRGSDNGNRHRGSGRSTRSFPTEGTNGEGVGGTSTCSQSCPQCPTEGHRREHEIVSELDTGHSRLLTWRLIHISTSPAVCSIALVVSSILAGVCRCCEVFFVFVLRLSAVVAPGDNSDDIKCSADGSRGSAIGEGERKI